MLPHLCLETSRAHRSRSSEWFALHRIGVRSLEQKAPPSPCGWDGIQAKLTGLGCTENGGMGEKNPTYKHNGIFEVSHHLGALSLASDATLQLCGETLALANIYLGIGSDLMLLLLSLKKVHLRNKRAAPMYTQPSFHWSWRMLLHPTLYCCP